ncbi:MAG: hypothetical protein ACRDUA_03820 [Micromonosporaceae bacterium]
MFRSILSAFAIGVLALVVAPSSGALASPTPTAGDRTTNAPGEGWEPVEYHDFNLAAGVRCDFAVHGTHPVNEVMVKVLERYPDGSPKREAYTGDLIVRTTNTETGASTDSDASGDALVEYRPDGSQFWYVKGPVFIGFGEGKGNMPRGLYVVDGTYTLEISSTGYKTVTMKSGSTHDVCADID